MNYYLYAIYTLGFNMGAEQSHSDSKLQQLNRLETKYSRMNKGNNKAEKVRDKIMFLRGYLGVQGSESKGNGRAESGNTTDKPIFKRCATRRHRSHRRSRRRRVSG